MITIIAGSRWANEQQTYRGIELCPWHHEITLVLCGMCDWHWDRRARQWCSADMWGRNWAVRNGIPVEEFPADYDRYALKAPPIRNSVMVAKAHALLLVWDGGSRGSLDVRKKAVAGGLEFFEYVYEGRNDGHDRLKILR